MITCETIFVVHCVSKSIIHSLPELKIHSVMATYTLQQLADMYGTSKRTFERHFKTVKSKFKKTSIGVHYNEIDAKQIAELMHFTIPTKSDK